MTRVNFVHYFTVWRAGWGALYLWGALLLFMAAVLPALAQENAPVQLRLNRDFGYAAGGRIQGTFSLRAEGPADLARVVFFVDGEPIGEDTEAPFRLQFLTGTYAPGMHTMSAVGYTADGRSLPSNEIQREFVSGTVARSSTIRNIALVIGVVIAGQLVITYFLTRGQEKSGQVAISGPFGGTICANCGRPFALHLWGVNLIAGRLDRCPHCGKWGFFRRTNPAALQAAAERFSEAGTATGTAGAEKQEDSRRRLDDSRFEDSSGL